MRKTPAIRINQLKRYMSYAIGEILLVVIGILIALQINSWNEWRKDRIKEKIILKDLLNTLDLDIQTFQNDVSDLDLWNRSADIIIHALEDKTEYSDTLNMHFHLARITKQNLLLSNIEYQTYKDQGLDIITNKALSSEIIKLYEVTIPGTFSTTGLVNELYPEWDNHIVQNFDFIVGKGLIPNNYRALFTDHFYMAWVKAYKQGRIYLQEVDNKLIVECFRVKKLIQDSLNAN